MIYFLVAVAVLLITSILLQQKESSLGSMAGSDTGQSIVQSRRGAEMFLHRFSIILSVLFLAGSIYLMVIA